VYGNIAHGLPLLIVSTVTHGFLWDAVCFDFATITPCQSLQFSWSIADAEATLIMCVFPKLPPRIPITVCALVFLRPSTYALAMVALPWLVA
jgi:hypothetical protein